MSNYTETLTITIPIALREIGKRLSRAFDPDIGGYEAYNQFLNADMQPCEELDAVYTTYSSPCTAQFKAESAYLLATPAAMQAAVAADYAVRWPEFEAPTLEECESFCKHIVNQETKE